MLIANTLDATGMTGLIFHYSLLLAMAGSTLLAMFYFWRKGRLDMDEEHKYKMLENDPEEY